MKVVAKSKPVNEKEYDHSEVIAAILLGASCQYWSYAGWHHMPHEGKDLKEFTHIAFRAVIHDQE